jgi:hypothetical protein
VGLEREGSGVYGAQGGRMGKYCVEVFDWIIFDFGERLSAWSCVKENDGARGTGTHQRLEKLPIHHRSCC